MELGCETLQPRGIYSKLGEIYSDTEAISPSHGRKSHSAQQAVVPPKRAWYGIDGVPLAVQWANDPEVWLCRCIRAGSGHKTHSDLHKQWGEPSPVQWQRTHLCPGEHSPWSPIWEDLCAALLWGCSQGMASQRAAPEPTALSWGSCGFHLTKTFPWRVSLSHSCCRGLPPCQVQSSSCLLRFQMLAARQAKGALSSTCYLEVAPVIAGGLFLSFEGRGGGSLLPGGEHVAQMEAGGAAGGWGGAIFICRQTALPWGQLCRQDNPRLQGTRGLPSPSCPVGSNAPVTQLWAGKTLWIQIPPWMRDNVR